MEEKMVLTIVNYYRPYKEIEFDPNGLIRVRDQDGLCCLLDKEGKQISDKYLVIYKFKNDFALVENNNLYGIIDINGHEIVPCKYKYVHSFNDNLCLVENTDGLWGYVNKEGEEVIGCQYKNAYPFSEGMAAVSNGNRDHPGKWGFINENGELVIDYKYKDFANFSEGLAAVMNDNGKWGFIDKNGRKIILCEYEEVDNFNEGLCAAIKKEGETSSLGFIDKKGNTIIPFEYDDKYDDVCSKFHNGMAIVRKNLCWGVIDKENDVIVPFKHNSYVKIDFDHKFILGVVSKFNGLYIRDTKYYKLYNFKGEYLGEVDSFYGFLNDLDKKGAGKVYLDRTMYNRKIWPKMIDAEGNEVDYDIYANDYSEGYTITTSTNWNQYLGRTLTVYGYADKNGKQLVKNKYLKARPFKEGMAAVQQVPESTLRIKDWGFIDKQGKEISSFNYCIVNDFNEGLALVCDINGLYSFINKTGKPISNKRYYAARDFHEGLAAVLTGKGWIYIDKKGNKVIELGPSIEEAFDFENGIAKVTNKQGESYYIDKNGKYVFGYEFCSDIHVGDKVIQVIDNNEAKQVEKKKKILEEINSQFIDYIINIHTKGFEFDDSHLDEKKLKM